MAQSNLTGPRDIIEGMHFMLITGYYVGPSLFTMTIIRNLRIK
jgi:hypothetical protein